MLDWFCNFELSNLKSDAKQVTATSNYPNYKFSTNLTRFHPTFADTNVTTTSTTQPTARNVTRTPRAPPSHRVSTSRTKWVKKILNAICLISTTPENFCWKNFWTRRAATPTRLRWRRESRATAPNVIFLCRKTSWGSSSRKCCTATWSAKVSVRATERNTFVWTLFSKKTSHRSLTKLKTNQN